MEVKGTRIKIIIPRFVTNILSYISTLQSGLNVKFKFRRN